MDLIIPLSICLIPFSLAFYSNLKYISDEKVEKAIYHNDGRLHITDNLYLEYKKEHLADTVFVYMISPSNEHVIVQEIKYTFMDRNGLLFNKIWRKDIKLVVNKEYKLYKKLKREQKKIQDTQVELNNLALDQYYSETKEKDESQDLLNIELTKEQWQEVYQWFLCAKDDFNLKEFELEAGQKISDSLIKKYGSFS